MTISEVAERTGLSTHAIRFYEQNGLLPRVQRSESGIRRFSAADVSFLQFLVTLKQTGMPLDEIAEFTADGCILERLEVGDIPYDTVDKRVAILEQHRQRLCTQRQQIDVLIDAVDKKLAFYTRYIASHEGTKTDEER